MRAGELLGAPVHDRSGGTLGQVLDIRLVKLDDDAPTGGWGIEGVVVGHRRAYPRAGYAYGGLSRPWPLAAALRALGRHLRYVPWESLRTNDGGGGYVCTADRSALSHPADLG